MNEQAGISGHWEYRSFKEMGIDREPTVHLGSGAGALERKGMRSDRGNINREIMEQNSFLENAENEYKEAVKKAVKAWLTYLGAWQRKTSDGR